MRRPSNRLSPRFCRLCWLIAAAAAVLFTPIATEAAPLVGDSSSFGLSVDLDLSVAGAVTSSASLAPTPTASGSAPGPYSEDNTVASASANAGLNTFLGDVEVISVESGGNDADDDVLNATASSDITGADVNSFAAATASLDNTSVDIGQVNLLGTELTSFLTLNADVITSSADVTGSTGSLTPTGSSTILDADGNAVFLNVLGTDFLLDTSTTSTSLSPSFIIDSGDIASLVGSIEVYVNEQNLSGNGTTNQSIGVNALRLEFIDVELNTGLTDDATLNGSITFSNSQASMNAVPEPSSLALLSVIGFGFTARRLRRKPACG